MVKSSHVIPGSRFSSTKGRSSKRGISDDSEAVKAATAAGTRTSSEETGPQPRGKKRKAEALSEDRDKGGDSIPSAIDSTSSEEELSTRKRNKGKEREHTPNKEDSQEENVANLNGDSQEPESEEEDDEDEEVLDLEEEEELDDDDNGPLYHHVIWNRLINVANRSGSYTHPPAQGDEPEDVTAFKACSATWGKDRANRPSVLSLWMAPPSQNNPEYDIQPLTYNNRLVLDWEGDPVRKFRELPATIASTVEGWRVEAWIRNDNRVTYRDIVARMRTKSGPGGRIPVYGTRALATRASLFRDHAGCISWRLLASQARARAFMDRLRTPTQRANNLTTDQDLASAQRAAFYSMSRSSRSSQNAIVGTAGLSASRPNVAGSSNAGPSRSRRKAPNSGAAGSDTPGLSAPPRRSGRRTTSKHCKEDSSRNVTGENTEHEQHESDKDGSFLDRSLIDEGDEEAQLPYSFFLDEWGEHLSNSDSDSFDFDSDDSSPDYSIGSEPEDPNDARNHIPADIDEAMMLRAALDATRDDFRRLTGRTPMETDPMENYFSQWAAYQTQLKAVFQAQGKTDDRTILFGLDGWVGGIPNWKSARPALDEGIDENEES